MKKGDSLWKIKQDKKIQRETASYLIDKAYEHTEFEILRKLYGDEDAFHVMVEKCK